MFQESPPWDLEHKYRLENIQALFVDEDQGLWEVDLQTSLSRTLTHPRFVVQAWTLEFVVLARSGAFRSTFLKSRSVHPAWHARTAQ
ncbi:tetratricopeptide repeat protein 4-like [Lampetra fluviatilis]